MSEPEIKVEKRRITPLRKKHCGREYRQYVITLPKEFAERQKAREIYFVANQIWMGVPDYETLIQILKVVPEIEDLLRKRGEADE
ncbi:MAG: hypothetical protein QMD10_10635 [Desulfitobacteriaceae bacterium]|nr:hypothetical protein [Desulfitobacteriaceae bacterium]